MNKKKLLLSLACLVAVSSVGALCACKADDNGGDNDGVTRYEVVFDTLGGSAVSSLTLEAGDIITRPAGIPTKEMFTFGDWYTDTTFTQKFSFGGEMPEHDITVYAGWIGEASVKVTLNANGGSFADGKSAITELGAIGSALSAEQPSYTGYVFGGWFTDPECNNAYSSGVFPVDNIELFAGWNNDSSYAYVSYYGNGRLVEKTPVLRGSQISAPKLFDDGIVCTDWYTDSAMTSVHTFGAVNSDMSLYASYYTRGLEITGGTVTGYNGVDETVVVPTKFNGVTVTTIGENAFYKSSELSAITSVILPETVTTVANGAFYECRYLIDVGLTDKVTTIGDNAFYNNARLKSCGDTSSVTSIGEAAFAGCKALRNITLTEKLVSLGNYAFSGCELLENVVLPSKIRVVGDYMFSDCKALKQVDITSSSLTSINTCAFVGCVSLETVFIRSVSVPTFRTPSNNNTYSPFAGCEKVKIYVAADAIEAYRNAVGHLDDGKLVNKLVALG